MMGAMQDDCIPVEDALANRHCPADTYATCKGQWQQDSIERYCMHNANDLLKEGDALIFIDYPQSSRTGSIGRVDCNGMTYQSQTFRVHSERLLETGSAKFAEMLRPTYQYRVQRRRKIVNNLPEGVKYVLDLTPPEEGEELVFQMTELSITPGIADWWSAAKFHGIDEEIVEGHDDVCECFNMRSACLDIVTPLCEPCESPCPSQTAAIGDVDALTGSEDQHSDVSSLSDKSTQEEAPVKKDEPLVPSHWFRDILRMLFPRRSANFVSVTSMNDISTEHLPPFLATMVRKYLPVPLYRKIEDYCPVRHRNGIIRVLMLIEGQSVSINSAARLWTMVGVAKIFECPKVMEAPATNWIMRGHNMKFIEVLPEETIRIGFALEMYTATRAAFRILVNEMAIDLAADGHNGRASSAKVTVFGRKREDLDDEIKNLIQHSAQVLCERVERKAQILCEESMSTHGISEWQNMQNLEAELTGKLSCMEGAERTLNSLKTLMMVVEDILPLSSQKTFMAEQFNRFDSLVGWDTRFDKARASYVETDNYEDSEDVMRRLNLTQRLLCGVLQLDFRTLRSSDLLRPEEGPLWRAETRFRQAAANMAWKNPEQEIFRLPDQPRGEFELYDSMSRLRDQILASTDELFMTAPHIDLHPYPSISTHLLLALNEDELKFLPLFAGGCNDGTGGVFEDAVPEALMGPSGPGPVYHTGNSIPSAPGSVDSFVQCIRDMNVMGSSTAGSVDVNGSSWTGYRRDEVIADDRSIASESDATEGAEYADARMAVPADHQPQALALRDYVEESPAQVADMDVAMAD